MFANELIYVGGGIIAAAVGGIIVAAAIAGGKFFTGSHDLKARIQSEERQKLAGMLRWFYGTPADPITGTNAIPGAMVTFPLMQGDIGQIKDMVTDLVASQHGVDSP